MTLHDEQKNNSVEDPQLQQSLFTVTEQKHLEFSVRFPFNSL